MHSHLLHRHPARRHAKREDLTLENDDSLAKVVERDANVATIYSVVYVTASASFTGSTAGYVTLGASSIESSAAAAVKSTGQSASSSTSAGTTTTAKTTLVKSATAGSSSSSSSASSTSAGVKTMSSQTTTSSASSTSGTSTSSSSSSSVSSSAVSPSSSVSSSSTTAVSGTALAEATVSGTASSSATAAASTGMSSGAKGGIAFAVILALGVIAGLALFCYRRKKSQRQNREGAQRLADDEKRAPTPVGSVPAPLMAAAAPPRNNSPAPRLSIRPTSRFSLGTDPEKTAAAIAGGRTVNSDIDPANPFGIHAERVAPATDRNQSPTPLLSPSPSNVSFELQGSPVPPPNSNAQSNSAPATAPVLTPVKEESPSPSSEAPMSPTKAEIGTASAVPLIATIGAATAASGANNVHRVQLDFKPSMDDELELKPGQLVRVLHEYDDGWALCMTMDRSKQGVAPRTCVSKLPLKPRPTGPSNGRPTSPMGPPPQGGMRKVSGPPRINSPSMVPAPLSPAMAGRVSPAQSRQGQRTASGPGPQVRSMSPSPNPSKSMADARRRSASVGSVNSQKPGSSAGSSPLRPLAVPARKPVPGQAM